MIFLLLGLLGTVPASAGEELVPTHPEYQVISHRGRLVRRSTDFIQLDDGSLGLVVRLWFRPHRRAVAKSAYFRLESGELRRDGNDLYYTDERGELLIAHKEWWYSNWELIDGAKIKADVKRVARDRGYSNFKYEVSAVLSLPDTQSEPPVESSQN